MRLWDCVWVCERLCEGLAAWLRLNEGLDESDWDAVPDWLGLPVAVCEALGAHVCWIAESRTARKDASTVHVAPLSLERRLAYAAAVPGVGVPPEWRLKGGAPEMTRE